MKQNEERLDNWERKAQILRERYLEERELERIQRNEYSKLYYRRNINKYRERSQRIEFCKCGCLIKSVGLNRHQSTDKCKDRCKRMSDQFHNIFL